MASKQFAGLFGGASPGDIRSLMEQENQGRVRQAFLDQTKAGGGPLAANAARYREQGLQGLDRMLGAGAGLTGMGLPQDPRMVKANKREADKKIIMAKLGEFNNDGTITLAEYKEGEALLTSMGYPQEAQKWMENAEKSFKMNLEQQKVNYIGDKVDIAKSKLKLSKFLGLGNLSLSRRNQKLKELAQKQGMEVNWAELGLKEKDFGLKKDIFIATQAFKEKTLGYQKEIDAVNTKLKKRGLEINEEGNLISRTAMEAGVDLNKRKFTLEEEGQLFNQERAVAREGISRMLANHTITQDGKVLNHKVLSSERQWELGKAQHDLNKELGLKGLSLKQDNLKLQKYATEHNIELKYKGHDLNKKKHAENQELLRDRFAFDKDKFDTSMNETAKQRVVNMELSERKLELQERGINIDELDKNARRSLASEIHAEDKRMNIHKMDHQEKQLYLTEQLANYSNHWKGRADEVARMSLTQKKEQWKETLDHQAKMKHLEGKYRIGAARIKAGAPKPRTQSTFGEKEHDVLNDIVSQGDNWNLIKEKFKGREEYTRGWASVDADTRREIGDALSGIMAKDKTMTINQAFAIYAGKNKGAGTGGDAFGHAKRGGGT